MTRYIIDQQTHEEIAHRHPFFWRSHMAEPLSSKTECGNCANDADVCEFCSRCYADLYIEEETK